MGFTTGFTGGITLTLSLAYLFTYTHQSSRIAQSNILRSSTHALDTALSPVPPPPPPSRKQIAALERQSITERFKDWWNGEIEGAVRSLQRTDWDALRDAAEGKIMSVVKGQEWKPEFSPEAWAQATKARAESVGQEIRGQFRDKGNKTAQTANEAATAAGKTTTHGLADQAREAYTNARHKAGELAGQAREGMENAKHKVEDAAATAKARVHMAEEKWEGKAEGKILHLSDVERALQERFDDGKRENAMRKSVDEALEERYKGSGKGDGELKGI